MASALSMVLSERPRKLRETAVFPRSLPYMCARGQERNCAIHDGHHVLFFWAHGRPLALSCHHVLFPGPASKETNMF